MKKSDLLMGLSIAAAIAVAASTVIAADDPIAGRKALMKAVGGATKAAGTMVKGEAPFDAAKAKASMDTIAGTWTNFSKLFPKGSETGGETTAAPKIWETFDDFDAKGKKLSADAAAAATAAASGPDAFKTAFGEVAKNCKGCHEAYRIQKK